MNRLLNSYRSVCIGAPQTLRRGFTLVEMLVSVALVLLMMSLFAQVFQIAAGTVSTQRGIMENDQRARSIQTVVTTDLNNRTFQYVWPWALRPSGHVSKVNFEESQMNGYFYISENDPYDDTDDVLQFTAKINRTVSSLSETDRYIGRATQVGTSFNQPDMDDGLMGNRSSQSSTAEICYFMRRGHSGRPGALYRRVLLVREPSQASFDDQPLTPAIGGEKIFDSTSTVNYPGNVAGSPPPPRVFWNDFDFSARPLGPGLNGVTFNTLSSLRSPANRFGFQFDDGTGNAQKPREYLTTGDYFGRFTMEETSHANFAYPFISSPSPMSQAFGALTIDAATGVVEELKHNGTSRRGEDLLLANVVSFDVKVWDDFANSGAGGFVDIGEDAAALYSMGRRTNPDFGPGGSASNRVYDTWHPPKVSAPSGQYPPFEALLYRSSTQRWNSTTAAGAEGTVVLAANASDYPGDPVYFVKTGATTATPPTNSGLSIPTPIVYGARVFDSLGFEWLVADNRRPMRAIQITVRFLDGTSQQLRSVTMDCELAPRSQP
jgi:prepilin-type N-terminal cleavage/methylation domain-containing protein